MIGYDDDGRLACKLGEVLVSFGFVLAECVCEVECCGLSFKYTIGLTIRYKVGQENGHSREGCL